MMKTDIAEALPKVLTGQVKPSESPFVDHRDLNIPFIPYQVTTGCVEAELKKLGPDCRGALISSKRFERRRCPHYKPISASDCLASIIGG